MNISKKWSVAAAASLSIALVAGGAVSANAAPGDPVNPQPNGSKGSFFIYDANTGDYADAVPGATPTRVYTRNEALIASASSTDVLAEINPSATRPVTGATPFTGVYKFLSAPTAADRDGGENTWNAYSMDSASGPNGGTLTPDFTLNSFAFGPGGIADDIAAGGTYWYGVAYTINNGVTVIGTVYREITIQAGTGNYTIGPVVVETAGTAPAVTTQPTSASVTAGADATFTAAASGTPTPTVQWESSTDGTTWANVAGATSATLTVPATTVAQSGTQYRAVFSNGTLPNATTNSVQLTVTAAITEPTDAANAASKKPITAVDGIVTLTGVTPGTYTARAWSTPTELGSIVVPASGVATITVPAALQDGAAHTFGLFQADNTVVAWGNVLVPAPEFPLTSTTQLTANVTVSGKFALEGVNAGPVALGTAKRGATTAPVKLGAFTVTDDRDDLKGWTLNATVADFTGPAGTQPIPGTALGLAAIKVGGAVDGITTRPTAKVAGDDWTSTLVAEGAPLSNTVETGTQFDADLTFKAPAKAKKGTYNSTLTLTLASK